MAVDSNPIFISSGLERELRAVSSCSKAIFVISDGKFRNNLLVGCRNDAAIMFVLGNINSNKVHGHRKNLLNKYFSTVVFHREFGCVIT